MKNISVLLVEDDVIQAMEISEELEDSNMGIEITLHVTSGEDALAQINPDIHDIVLMDIKLEKGNGKLSGIDTAKIMKSQYDIPIVFLTAFHSNRVYKSARSSQPAAFLEKPFEVTKVCRAIDLATFGNEIEKHENQNASIQEDQISVKKERMLIKKKEGYSCLDIQDIVAVKSDNVYIEIYSKEGKDTLCIPMGTFVKMVDDPSFFRTHRSWIINLNAIKRVAKRATHVYIQDLEIPVSEPNRKSLMQHFIHLKNDG